MDDFAKLASRVSSILSWGQVHSSDELPQKGRETKRQAEESPRLEGGEVEATGEDMVSGEDSDTSEFSFGDIGEVRVLEGVEVGAASDPRAEEPIKPGRGGHLDDHLEDDDLGAPGDAGWCPKKEVHGLTSDLCAEGRIDGEFQNDDLDVLHDVAECLKNEAHGLASDLCIEDLGALGKVGWCTKKEVHGLTSDFCPEEPIKPSDEGRIDGEFQNDDLDVLHDVAECSKKQAHGLASDLYDEDLGALGNVGWCTKKKAHGPNRFCDSGAEELLGKALDAALEKWMSVSEQGSQVPTTADAWARTLRASGLEAPTEEPITTDSFEDDVTTVMASTVSAMELDTDPTAVAGRQPTDAEAASPTAPTEIALPQEIGDEAPTTVAGRQATGTDVDAASPTETAGPQETKGTVPTAADATSPTETASTQETIDTASTDADAAATETVGSRDMEVDGAEESPLMTATSLPPHTVPMETEYVVVDDGAKASDSDSDDEGGTSHSHARMDLVALATLVVKSEATLEAAAGADCVLVVGNTGAGKSLLCNMLATGARPQRVEGGLRAAFEVPSAKLEIGHGKTSTTRGLAYLASADNELLYVDAPGFADTSGPEVDVVTSMAVRRIAQVCASLRLVVVINCCSLLNDRAVAVLELARLVSRITGDNFRDVKKGCIFVFTHADAVAHLEPLVSRPDELRDAVRLEIDEMLEGGHNCPQAREVLKHLERALRKAHTYADVFHPTASDSAALAKKIRALEPLHDADRVVKCAIPPLAFHALDAEVRRILDAAVSRCTAQPPLASEDGAPVTATEATEEPLAEPLRACRFLANKFDRIRPPLERFERALLEACESTERSAIHSLAAGLTVSSTQGFSEADARAAAVKLRRLDELHALADLDPSDLADQLVGCLIEMAEDAAVDRDLDAVAARWRYLQAWSVVPELAPRLEQARDALGDRVRAAVDAALSRAVEPVDDGDWRCLSARLEPLEQVHALGLSNVEAPRAALVARLRACVAAAVDAASRSPFEGGNDWIEAAAELVALAEACPSAVDKIVSAGRDDVVRRLRIDCDLRTRALEEAVEMLPSEAVVVKVCFESLLGVAGSALGSHVDAASARNAIARRAKTETQRLEVLSAQLETAGLHDAATHAQSLAALEACAWIDNSHAPDVCRLKKVYRNYVERTIRDRLDTLWHALDTNSPDSLPGPPPPEIVTLCPSAAAAGDAIADQLVQRWLEQNRELVRARDAAAIFDADVEAALRVAAALGVEDDIESPHFESLGRDLDNYVNERGNFKRKRQVLLALSRAERDLPHIARRLPAYADCVATVDGQMKKRGEVIRALVEAAVPDTAKIEPKLCALREAAGLVDEFIQGRASETAEHLAALLQTKLSHVDKRLEEHVGNRAWTELEPYLAPLRVATDSIQQERYRNVVKLIEVSVDEEVAALRACALGGPTSADFRVRLLALSEARDLETVVPKLKDATERLRKDWIDGVNRRLARLESALDVFDYVTIAQTRSDVELDCERGAALLPPRVSKKLAQQLEGARSALDDVQKSAESLVADLEAWLQKGSFPRRRNNVASKLRAQLDQLKKATSLPECQAGYWRATSQLKTKLDEVINECRRLADTSHFHTPMTVMGKLKSDFGELIELHLGVPVGAHLQTIRELEANFRSETKRDVLTSAGIAKMASKLDRLEKREYYRSWISWSRTDYDVCVRQVSETILNMRDDVRVELERERIDVEAINLKLTALKECARGLKRHVIGAGYISRELVEELSNEFTLSCDDVCDLADRRALSGLSEAFDRYTQLAKLCCEDICGDGRVTRVHERLLAWIDAGLRELDTALKNSDFARIAAETEQLQSLGFFMISNFALYNDELNLKRSREKTVVELKRRVREQFGDEKLTAIGRCYARLSLGSSADERIVRLAFNALARTTHPDKSSAKASTARMQELNEAKETLLDAANRACIQSARYHFTARVRELPTVLRQQLEEHLNDNAYDRAAEILSRLPDLHAVAEIVSIDRDEITATVVKMIKDHVTGLRTLVDSAWNSRDFTELQRAFTALDRVEANFKSHPEVYDEAWSGGIMEQVCREIERLGDELRHFFVKITEKRAFEELADFAIRLVRLGRIMDGLPRFKQRTRSAMSCVLDTVTTAHKWGFSFLFKLGIALEQGDIDEMPGDDRVAKAIVAEFPHFAEIVTWTWNEEVVQKDPEQSIREMTSERYDLVHAKVGPRDVPRSELLAFYKQYEAEYDNCFRAYISPEADRDQLVALVEARAASLRPCSADAWTSRVVESVPDILAGVLSLFTIIKSGDSFNRLEGDDGQTGDDRVLMKPHAIQVIAILRLLCAKQLPNHLLQIRTGEGKSLILGACSVVLALLGFRVRCVCYSEFLSERDNELFRDVFDAFGVASSIVYSKITKMSEAQVRAKGDVRALTLDLLRGELRKTAEMEVDGCGDITLHSNRPSHALVESNNTGSRQDVLDRSKKGADDAMVEASSALKARGPKEQRSWNGEEILLVDEVDVFFSPDFYGQSYTQVVQFEHGAAERLLKRVWAERNCGLNPHQVQSWPEYTALRAALPAALSGVLDFEIRAMCADVAEYNTPAYVLCPLTSRVGYPVKDSVDYDLVYGYRTAFAYYAEIDKGAIRSDVAATLQKNLSLRIFCGQYSYAKISPTKIFGVSGTLSALSPSEKAVMARYGIELYDFVPSVYGATNFKFDKAGRGIVVEPDETSFMQTLADEILRALRDDRAVIVFFETEERLRAFKSSAYGRKIQHKLELTTDLNKDERNYVIKKAATSGQCTLATAVFGRGTDFFCKDKKLNDSGGTHIIQTYLSLEKTEEVQVMGRTARQGKRGSYGMVLRADELKDRFGIDGLDNVAADNLYSTLDQARLNRHAQELGELDEALAEANTRDAVSRDYLDALLSGETAKATDALLRVYEQLPDAAQSTAVDVHFVVDVSGSMGSRLTSGRTRLDTAKVGIRYIIENVLDAGRGDKLSLTTFQSTSSDVILDASVEDQARLIQLVDTMSPDGGTRLLTALIRKLGRMLSNVDQGTQRFLFVFTDGATGDMNLMQQATQFVNQIPDSGFKFILAGVGLGEQYRQQFTPLTATGKMDLILFDSTEQVAAAFDVAAETIVQLTGGYVA